MKKKKVFSALTLLTFSTLLIAGCAGGANSATDKSSAASSSTAVSSSAEAAKEQSKGQELTEILSSTDWQGTKVYDKNNNDLTAENANFIGLAKYDGETGFYEFFDKETDDGEKRILISDTQNYQAVVDLTEVTKDKFTYKRMGKDKDGKDVEVFVEHIPYSDEKLTFTNGRKDLETETGKIVTSEPGDDILGATLWNGTKVLDEDGNDVTEANKMFISLAKFDNKTSKYEFFDLETGKTRGDFGYFQVIDNNKIRAHVSIGDNKYGAALELTELNDKRFTYTRMGKDNNGKEIKVFVEHEPYEGDFTPDFTF